MGNKIVTIEDKINDDIPILISFLLEKKTNIIKQRRHVERRDKHGDKR